MVKQYPHTISFTKVSGSSQDGNGDWIPGVTTQGSHECRFEANSKGAMVAGPDGTNIIFDGIVYMPLPMETLAPGTVVQILEGATVLLKNTVKRFSPGQLNARAWL